MCVAISSELTLGNQVTLIAMPIAGSTERPVSVHAAQVVARSAPECATGSNGVGIHKDGDSLYTVAVVADSMIESGPLFVVALPIDQFRMREDGAFVDARLPDRPLAFRICTSGEGLHLTAWLRAPLSGRRVWHRDYYLGYDTEPSCVPADYEGTG
jgi:hypothetical protein